MHWWFSRSFKSFSLSYTILNFLFASYWSETLLRIPFSVIGRCSLVPTCHWLQGKCARNNLSQAASGIILQNHRRPPVSIFSVKNRRFPVTRSLKQVTGSISNLVSNFKEQAKTFEFDFFHQLINKKLQKLSAHAQKALFFIISLQKIFISWYNPLKNYICPPPPPDRWWQDKEDKFQFKMRNCVSIIK